MSDKNLLITIIDTNPLWWGLLSDGHFKSELSKSSNLSKISNPDNFDFGDFLSAVIGFINAYKTMNQNNAVVLIAAHNTKADYLFPSKSKILEKYTSPWDKYEQISDIDDQIRDNLKNFISEHLTNLQNEGKNKDNSCYDSMVTSAIGLGLCYINRIQRKYTFADTCKYRFLIIKASEDSSNQYMNFMNMIFTAEKLNVIVDSCTLMQDSSLLQQASNLTNGFYFKVPQLNGLLNYLLWLYLPDEATRKMLMYPPKTDVDYRAACFCHKKLIEVGYVCSVCLSVFCSFTPICSTCNCNFQFDVNMLKKASSLKHGSFLKQQNRQLSTNPDSNQKDYNENVLSSQFKDTSLSSPSVQISDNEPMNIDSSSKDTQQAILGLEQSSSNGLSRNNHGSRSNMFNDSLDMLE